MGGREEEGKETGLQREKGIARKLNKRLAPPSTSAPPSRRQLKPPCATPSIKVGANQKR